MIRFLILSAFVCCTISTDLLAQEKSVRPGINDSFRDPNVSEYIEKFEIESREVFSKRTEIVAVCDIAKGASVADVGAGTGIFTRQFSDAVGKDGHVLAVDITQKFLDHIDKTNRETDRKNVQTILCTAEDTKLMPGTIDMAFVCDTYHHFEFPLKTMTSLHAALKPRGRLFVIDFKRIDGESTDWTMKHVRAGQDVFESEILSCGFKKVGEHSKLLKENYFVEFEKVAN